MRYLSIDIEATGLKENDLIIEFGMVPVCSDTRSLKPEWSFHRYIKCPSFEELKPKLDPWVIEHNKELIEKAHQTGVDVQVLKKELTDHLNQEEIRHFFDTPNEKITLLGKSMNAIDLPFLNRDLGWEYIRTHFNHQTLDVSSIVMNKIDQGVLPIECKSGSKLSNYLKLGEVGHTALEDAIQTAEIYFKLLEL